MSLFWTIWLLGLLLVFAVGETWALRKGKLTLSRWTWQASQQFPLILVFYGMIFGGLAVHFFWHWCPGGCLTSHG